MKMDLIDSYIYDLKSNLDQLSLAQIRRVITLLHSARLDNQQVFILGNGGSASTASHFVCDLGKNTRRADWPNFRVFGLTDNMPIFSAYANDEGYENVFALQLASYVRSNDIVIGISTSGNSPNVINAIELAREMGAKTVGLTGFDGGRLRSLVDFEIHVNSDCIEYVEDIHLMLEHLICKALRDFGQNMSMIEHQNGIEDLNLLYSLGRELSMEVPLSNLLHRILQLSLDNIGAVSGCILTLGENGEINEAAMAYAGEIHSYSTSYLEDTLQRGLAGWVVKNQRPALVASTLEDSRWLQRSWDSQNGSARSAVSVPIMNTDRVLGVLTLVHSQADKFTHHDLVLLAAVAVCASMITAKTRGNLGK